MAAIALTEEGHDEKTYTITGPAAITHTQMASAITEAIGKPVALMTLLLDAFAGALRAAGVPAVASRRPRWKTTRITRAVRPKRSRRMFAK